MRLTAAGVTFSSAAAEAKLPAISGYYDLQGKLHAARVRAVEGDVVSPHAEETHDAHTNRRFG